MSQLNTKKVKFGDNADLSKNFVWSVPAVADGTFTLAREDGTIVWQIPTPGGAISLSNNLDFAGASRRITGDFSNSSFTQRLLFQSNTVNGETNIGVIPNGTSKAAVFTVYGNSDPTNASIGVMYVSGVPGNEQVVVGSNKSGTGVSPSVIFVADGTEAMRIEAVNKNVKVSSKLVTPTNAIYFIASSNTITVPNGLVDTLFPTWGFENDPKNAFNTANGRFQPNIAGVYNVSASVNYSADGVSNASTVVTRINKNGGVATAGQFAQSTLGGTQFVVVSGSVLVELNGTTDYVTVSALHNASGPATTVRAEMCAHLVYAL